MTHGLPWGGGGWGEAEERTVKRRKEAGAVC
jgi:hypothetical protein